MKSIIEKICFMVFSIGVLYSCTKDDMEVQKNTDLTWEISKDVASGDVRNSLGYDPRLTYVAPSTSELEISIFTFGDLVLSEKTTKEIIVSISMDKVAKKDIKIAIEYNADLYDELKNKYGGYALGEENLVTIPTKEAVIHKGGTSVTFEIEANFKKVKRLILPFSLKIEGDEEVKTLKGADMFVLKVDIENALDKQNWKLIPSESSEKIKQMYDEAYDSLFNAFYSYKLESVNIGITGIRFEGFFRGFKYSTSYNCDFQIEGKTLSFSNTKEGNYWNYFGYQPFADMIVNNAPYNIEKEKDSSVKLISVNNPEIWFIIKR